ncbi:MAG: DUF1844 domain-containing protein [Deltaproteobacteria bacterium]|jgi:hypothetical protein|nr:DUF1844 domain-containing protein [Deltaproteobacteria bacterium]
MTEFEVNDRRLEPRNGAIEAEEAKAGKPGTGEGGQPKPEARQEPKQEPKPAPKAGDKAEPGSGPRQQGSWVGDEPAASFATLVVGLGTSALLNMGETSHPDQHPLPKDLNVAKHIIDVMGMLQKKTEGNLTEDEKQLLSSFLFELRMKFVEILDKESKQAQASPTKPKEPSEEPSKEPSQEPPKEPPQEPPQDPPKEPPQEPPQDPPKG